MLSKKIRYSSIYLIFFYLVGCAGVTTVSDHKQLGIDRIACVGEIEAPPEGLIESNDKELLLKAMGASGEGKLCTGKVFLAEQPVTVYRVWNSSKSYTVYGGWWSFEQPSGPKQEYREDNGICPSWSTLDRMTSCTIKVGAEIVVGPGQSAKCEKFTYPKSAVNQVFIPNDSRNDVIFVENCTKGVFWP